MKLMKTLQITTTVLEGCADITFDFFYPVFAPKLIHSLSYRTTLVQLFKFTCHNLQPEFLK